MPKSGNALALGMKKVATSNIRGLSAQWIQEAAVPSARSSRCAHASILQYRNADHLMDTVTALAIVFIIPRDREKSKVCKRCTYDIM